MSFLGKIREKLKSGQLRQVLGELRWLWDRAGQFRFQILTVCALALTGTVMGLGSSVASKYLIDAVTGQSRDVILGAAVLMAAMTLGSIGLQALSSGIGASIHIKVKNRVQHMTYSRILRAGWEALEPYRSGDLLNRLNSDVNVVSDGVISLIPGTLSIAVRFVGAFAIMLYFDPIMACIALAGVPVTLVMSRFLLSRMRQHSIQMKELTGEVVSFQEDSFRNLTSIKAFSLTDRFVDRMGQLQGNYADAFLTFNRFKIRMSAVLSLTSAVVSGCCLGWGVYQLWAGVITFGSLTMFLQLASTLRAAFSSLVNLAQQLVGLTTSAGRIMAVEALPVENETAPEALRRERDLAIRMEGVSFRYRSGDTILDPFDLFVNPGELVAVTGPSGEGKTTLLRLLLGLVEPSTGEARLDGAEGNYPINAGSRGVFAYVPQGNSVFAGTVGENLRLGNPDATDGELLEALEAACALDFVNDLPDGLEHPLGAGGRGISEGQAQRLAIARALLRRAPILLLDEATSALDVATEQRILDNLLNRGWVRTCILVTHRPASAEVCGRGYEIRDGRVTEVRYEG